MTFLNRSYPAQPARFLGALATLLISSAASAQAAKPISPVIKINQAAATNPIESTPLRGPLTMLSGSGGNITVLNGREGKMMVDAGIAVSRPRVEAALKAISSAPIKYLIDTHYHWDHTDGNPWVHEDGAIIIGTAGTVKRVSEVTRVDDWDFTFEPLPASAVPTEIVTQNKTYHFAGQTVELRLLSPAHTDTDLYVFFKEANVASLGDLFWNGVYPFIDNENGGGINGMIEADDAILAQLNDQVVLAPGHGPVGNKKQFRDFRDMLSGVRDNVAALKKKGMTRDQVVAAKPTAKYDAVYGHFVIDPDFFTRIVFDGLK
jgi:glyoxylase-like metal-dependent hydrolase (beta-lactamase superfamily II)